MADKDTEKMTMMPEDSKTAEDVSDAGGSEAKYHQSDGDSP